MTALEDLCWQLRQLLSCEGVLDTRQGQEEQGGKRRMTGAGTTIEAMVDNIQTIVSEAGPEHILALSLHFIIWEI